MIKEFLTPELMERYGKPLPTTSEQAGEQSDPKTTEPSAPESGPQETTEHKTEGATALLKMSCKQHTPGCKL